MARFQLGFGSLVGGGIEHRLLRAVGTRPRHVFLLILGEALLLTLGGLVPGLILAAVSASLLEGAIVQRYGLSLAQGLASAHLFRVLGLLLIAGLVAGLLPAWRCYRRSLSDGLSPQA